MTANPALDLTYRVPVVKLDDTTRAREVLRAAGGKGINVSRVAARLGHPTVAMGFVGGRSGQEIEDLLHAEGVRTWFTRQREPTRVNAIVQDDAGAQIRVSGPGAPVEEGETDALLENVFDLRAPDFLVLSGSLRAGMPEDLYVTMTARAVADGVRVAADADGDELRAAVAAGAHLIKPNQYELERLVGRKIGTFADAAAAAREVRERGVELVLVSLGPQGALLAAPQGVWTAVGPRVEVDSAVGAGDSLLAGALAALAEGRPPEEALRLGVACGTATATTPGTELCYRDTIDRILPQVVLEARAG